MGHLVSYYQCFHFDHFGLEEDQTWLRALNPAIHCVRIDDDPYIHKNGAMETLWPTRHCRRKTASALSGTPTFTKKRIHFFIRTPIQFVKARLTPHPTPVRSSLPKCQVTVLFRNIYHNIIYKCHRQACTLLGEHSEHSLRPPPAKPKELEPSEQRSKDPFSLSKTIEPFPKEAPHRQMCHLRIYADRRNDNKPRPSR